MKFILEIQEYSEDSAALVTPVITRKEWNEAESEFCRLRSIAAVSNVPIHTIVFMESNGYVYDYKTYEHKSINDTTNDTTFEE